MRVQRAPRSIACQPIDQARGIGCSGQEPVRRCVRGNALVLRQAHDPEHGAVGHRGPLRLASGFDLIGTAIEGKEEIDEDFAAERIDPWFSTEVSRAFRLHAEYVADGPASIAQASRRFERTVQIGTGQERCAPRDAGEIESETIHRGNGAPPE